MSRFGLLTLMSQNANVTLCFSLHFHRENPD